MLRAALASSLLLIAAACAGPSTSGSNSAALKSNGIAFNQDSSAKKGPKVVCTMEREVGTNIPERVCRTVDEDSDRLKREQTQDEMRGVRSAPNTSR